MGGDGGCDCFLGAIPLTLSCAFRLLPATLAPSAFNASSSTPMMGSVGPSLEYGGVAVTVVILASFSADDANTSLVRFGFPITNDRTHAIVETKCVAVSVAVHVRK